VPVYDQLLAEGYFESRRGSGTFVAEAVRPATPLAPKLRTKRHKESKSASPRRLSALGRRMTEDALRYPYDEIAALMPARFEFLYGLPEEAAFPRADLKSIAARCVAKATIRSLAYAPPEGIALLREALADHLARARGVQCTPDQVMITSGIQQALDLLGGILLDPGDRVLIEDPHHIGARAAFLAKGAELIPAAVDGEGMDLGSVPRKDLERAVLAYVTPSHQFPIGSILSLRRRLELLSWAESAGAYVIEDDYDSEFRYGGRPIESLQSLDERGRVIYTGTFSKSLCPGLRIGYLVAPPELMEPLRSAKWAADWSAPTLLQEMVAAFLTEGRFERHIRRLRARYGAREHALREALLESFGDRIVLSTKDAGLHISAWLLDVPTELTGALQASARALDVGVHSIAPYYIGPPPPHAALVLGYTLVEDRFMPEAARRLAKAAKGVIRRRVNAGDSAV
jgi:GntR family transcriptional regulator/MocR family aminotransferase